MMYAGARCHRPAVIALALICVFLGVVGFGGEARAEGAFSEGAPAQVANIDELAQALAVRATPLTLADGFSESAPATGNLVVDYPAMLDLNGETLDLGTSSLVVADGGALTVSDGSAGATGTITSQNSSQTLQVGERAEDDAAFTLEDHATITNSIRGVALLIEGGSAVIAGGTVVSAGGKPALASSASAKAATLSITGGTVMSGPGSCGIIWNAGEAVVSGGKVGATPGYHTPAIAVSGSGAKLTVNGTAEVSGDWGLAALFGATVAIEDDAEIVGASEAAVTTWGSSAVGSSITISGGVLAGAKAGLYTPSATTEGAQSTVVVSGGTISGTSTPSAGVVNVGSNLTLSGTASVGCNPGESGATISIGDATLDGQYSGDAVSYPATGVVAAAPEHYQKAITHISGGTITGGISNSVPTIGTGANAPLMVITAGSITGNVDNYPHGVLIVGDSEGNGPTIDGTLSGEDAEWIGGTVTGGVENGATDNRPAPAPEPGEPGPDEPEPNPPSTNPPSPNPPKPEAPATVTVYRLYNRYLNGAHLFTVNDNELEDLIAAGWTFEGAVFTEYATQVEGSTPVFRLYNPYNGDHFFTKSEDEAQSLEGHGWTREGTAWYQAKAQSDHEVYRLYNPYQTEYAGLGNHLWTASLNERDTLVHIGWQGEGIGWYFVKVFRAK